ncbi:uncharacterized protein LOC114470598 [Gouania willdenowi]|uniref:uncharacterized protein LOC114470598 n=1 Tax=Gouania willdenowi TaxID=441366 RepID=UPI001054C53F|nr:uncharacterized protein LOC114470598 [Gouania willdenowi]
MWCFQIPQFEAHVISKLQKQQQCNQFCDTLLKAEGVSIPAHSWILSAISPGISSAFASTAAPPVGFTQLLEFGAFGACSLFHVVQLLYSGQMMGKGEKEKQEAFSAAARLGIHGLVEVTRTDRKQRNQQEVREVGVQTEPEEEERLRRETRGSIPPRQQETASGIGVNMWTQTEEIKAKESPPELAVTYQTLDVSALQMETNEDSSHMIPISFIYSPDEDQPAQPLSPWSPSEFTDSQPNTLVSSLPQSIISGLDASLAISPLPVIAEEQDKHLKQFEGNISGFISNFLNLNRESGPCGRRPRRPQGGRRRRSAERKSPRKHYVRRQGVLTQIVDFQQVWVVSRQHKLFMHRTGWRSCPKGQGGGAVGRRTHLKTRVLLNTSTNQQKTRVRSKVWEVSPSGDLRLRCGRNSTAQLMKQGNLSASLGERSKAKSTLTTTVSTQPVQTWDAEAPPVPGPVLQLSPSALHFLHPLQTPLSPDQPQCINHLLEKVPMGQEIQPNRDQLPSDTGTVTSISSVGNVAPDHPQGNTLSLQRSTEAVNGLKRGAGLKPDHEEDIALEKECEGEMNQILEKFLESFEQHIDCAQEERDAGSDFTSFFESSMTTPLPPSPRATAPQRDERQQISSLPHPEPNGTPARSLTNRGPKSSQLLEKMLKDRNMWLNKDVLLWNPVVKVNRIKVIPVKATRMGLDCPNPRNKGGGESKRKRLKAERPPTADRRQVGVHRRNRCVKSNGSDIRPVDGRSKSTEKIAPKQAKKRGRKRKSDSKDVVSAKVCFDQRCSPADATAVEPNCKREPSTDKKSNQDKEVGHTDTASVSASADVKTLPELKVESAGNQGEDDYIDVVTAASPAPSPVICWIESSAGEEEEEDIDVIS